MAGPKRVLVLCTGNSCRSQMAEGWIRRELGGAWEVCSAGTRPARRVNPLAVRAMAEVGIDISSHVPQHLEAFLDQPWDLVVTVCDSAASSCPVFPGAVTTLHMPFPDPVEAMGSDEQRLAVYRTVRDAIHDRLLPELRERLDRG